MGVFSIATAAVAATAIAATRNTGRIRRLPPGVAAAGGDSVGSAGSEGRVKVGDGSSSMTIASETSFNSANGDRRPKRSSVRARARQLVPHRRQRTRRPDTGPLAPTSGGTPQVGQENAINSAHAPKLAQVNGG